MNTTAKSAERMVRAQKQIADKKVGKVVPSSVLVIGGPSWEVFLQMQTQGATAFRRFRYNAKT